MSSSQPDRPNAPLSQTFCVMPWMNLSTETNGKCKICCVVNKPRYIQKSDGTDFAIHQDSIEDIWNSSYMKDLRSQLLRGEEAVDCSTCYEKEKLGLESPRDVYNKRWLDNETLQYVMESQAYNGHVSRLPTSLEPRPGTFCNLQCLSCWSLSSHSVEKQRRRILEDSDLLLPNFLAEQFQGEIHLAKQANLNWADSETYLRNFRLCLPRLTRVYFTGGEPLLIESNMAMLRELVACGRTDVLINFTTNLTVIPNGFLELLSHFKEVELIGSLDGYGELNTYLRYPSRWATVSQNLLHYKQASPHIKLCINSVVQAANVLSLIDLFIWIETATGTSPIEIWLSLLEHPAYMRLGILPKSLRQTALERIAEALTNKVFSSPNRERLQDLAQYIRNAPEEDLSVRQKFVQFTQVMDQVRKTQLLSIAPELQNLFVAAAMPYPQSEPMPLVARAEFDL